MPLPQGTKYRYKKGSKLRLAFNPKGKVIEAKNMETGATHMMQGAGMGMRKKKGVNLRQSMMGGMGDNMRHM